MPCIVWARKEGRKEGRQERREGRGREKKGERGKGKEGKANETHSPIIQSLYFNESKSRVVNEWVWGAGVREVISRVISGS